MKKPLCLLLVLFICYSCGEKVSFDEAQPAHVSALDKIPQKYWGTFLDEEDSSLLEINSSTIYETLVLELSEPFEEVFGGVEDEKDVKIVSQTDTEISIEIYEGSLQTFAIKNDSVFGTLKVPEVLFDFSQQDVVKHYKGYDYFSVLNKDGNYYLRKVSLEGEILTLSKIQKVLDVNHLIAIDKTSDAAGKGLKPTKRQFKKIAQSSFKLDRKLRRIE